MSGCMRNQPSGVIFKGWPYEPNLVQENIDFFTDQTKIDVTYQSISGNYHDKMVVLFVGKPQWIAATSVMMTFPNGLKLAGLDRATIYLAPNSTQKIFSIII